MSLHKLHRQLKRNLKAHEATDTPELRPAQKLRAAAAAEVFALCRPSFTPDDEDDLGFILGQLAGWVLHGNAYDPDLSPQMAEELARTQAPPALTVVAA